MWFNPNQFYVRTFKRAYSRFAFETHVSNYFIDAILEFFIGPIMWIWAILSPFITPLLPRKKTTMPMRTILHKCVNLTLHSNTADPGYH